MPRFAVENAYVLLSIDDPGNRDAPLEGVKDIAISAESREAAPSGIAGGSLPSVLTIRITSEEQQGYRRHPYACDNPDQRSEP